MIQDQLALKLLEGNSRKADTISADVGSKKGGLIFKDRGCVRLKEEPDSLIER